MEVERAEFLRWAEAEAGLAANTLLAYRRDLDSYGLFLRKKRRDVGKVKPRDIVDFLAHLRKLGRAETTIARRFACLRSFHRFLLCQLHRQNRRYSLFDLAFDALLPLFVIARRDCECPSW